MEDIKQLLKEALQRIENLKKLFGQLNKEIQ
jgi:hypothetical protein